MKFHSETLLEMSNLLKQVNVMREVWHTFWHVHVS